MADEEKDDRTEPASQRRLQQAAEKGQIALGRDLVSVASLAGGALALTLLGPRLLEGLVHLLRAALQRAPGARPADLLPLLARPALAGAAVIAAAAAAALLAGIAQTRGRIWPELALPDPERILQGGRLGRLFSLETPADLGLACVKVVAVGAAFWFGLRDAFLSLPALLLSEPQAILAGLFDPLRAALPIVLVALACAAGLDLAVARRRFGARMRMTRDELKRELKEDEGDPLVRSQRRRRHREMSRARVAVEVPTADVLLVNPTHVAVAIRYKRGEDRAPKVIARGKGQLAEIMRDLARSNGVPIVEDVPLARLLYKRVKVGREIPAEAYKAVAAVLALVYRLTRRAA